MRKPLILIILAVSSWMYAQQLTRFMVVGDTHLYSPVPDLKETILYELVLAAIEEQVDFIFFTGDLSIRGFSDPAEEDSVLKDWRFVLDTLSIHNIKVYACRGNNDVSSKEAWDSLFCDNYSLPLNGPENEKNITYALEYNNILFISLDQYTESHRINQSWLDAQLDKNQKPHLFMAAHEPAFKLLHSNCMAAYPRERDVFWESLIAAGTKIYFCGHDHFYDHTIIDDGDNNPHNDIHQIIVGTGSHLHSDSEYNGDNGRWTPVRLFHEETNGYILIQVNGTDVHLKWKHRIEQNIFEDGGDSYHFLTAINEKNRLINDYALSQNYPNPFNPSTTIKFDLPKSSDVTLEIFNILGEKVVTLVSDRLTAGTYSYDWSRPAGIANGIYLYRLKASDSSQGAGKSIVKTRKMVLMR